MTDVGNAFNWAFRDPHWLSKFLIIALIGLIPIVGQINTFGWMLHALDNFRRGYPYLPDGNFNHLGRGVNVFVVVLIYGLVLAIPAALLFLVAFAGSLAASASPQSSAATGALGLGFLPFFSFIFLFSLAIQVLHPSLILNTERGGIGGGLNVAAVIRTIQHRPGPTLIAGILFAVANFIGGLGVYLCCVGYLFTMPYSYSVMAGVMHSLEVELGLSPPAPPGGSAPAPGYSPPLTPPGYAPPGPFPPPGYPPPGQYPPPPGYAPPGQPPAPGSPPGPQSPPIEPGGVDQPGGGK